MNLFQCAFSFDTKCYIIYLKMILLVYFYQHYITAIIAFFILIIIIFKNLEGATATATATLIAIIFNNRSISFILLLINIFNLVIVINYFSLLVDVFCSHSYTTNIIN